MENIYNEYEHASWCTIYTSWSFGGCRKDLSCECFDWSVPVAIDLLTAFSLDRVIPMMCKQDSCSLSLHCTNGVRSSTLVMLPACSVGRVSIISIGASSELQSRQHGHQDGINGVFEGMCWSPIFRGCHYLCPHRDRSQCYGGERG
jgi:hypothetical protein